MSKDLNVILFSKSRDIYRLINNYDSIKLEYSTIDFDGYKIQYHFNSKRDNGLCYFIEVSLKEEKLFLERLNAYYVGYNKSFSTNKMEERLFKAFLLDQIVFYNHLQEREKNV